MCSRKQKSRRREQRQKDVQIIWKYCKCVRLLGADARCWWAGAQSERSSLGGQTPTQWAPYSLCCRVFNLSASLLFTHTKLQKRGGGGIATLPDPKRDAVWMRTLTWTGSRWRPRRGQSYKNLPISLMIFLTLRCSQIAGIFRSQINCRHFPESGQKSKDLKMGTTWQLSFCTHWFTMHATCTQ